MMKIDFLNKINDAGCVDVVKKGSHWTSNKIFTAETAKIYIINKNVLDSDMTSCTLWLVNARK